MREIIWGLGVLLGLSGITCGTGCNMPSDPVNEIQIGQYRLRNTKDTSVKVKGASFKYKDAEGKVDELEIIDSASAVMQWQVQKMDAWQRQMDTANQAILGSLSEIRASLGVLAPLGMQYMQTRQAIATQPPKLAQILDATGRVVGQFNLSSSPGPAEEAQPSPATIVLPPGTPVPQVIVTPSPPPAEQDD